MKEATEAVNESKRSAEDQGALLRIDEELGGKCKGLIVAHRKFIYQEEVDFYQTDEIKEKEKFKERKGIIYLFNDILVFASKENSVIGSKQKLKYQWALPLNRLEITDSKQIYQGAPSDKPPPPHPIRAVQSQLGCNPELIFHLKLNPSDSPIDTQLESLKSSRDLLIAIEDTPAALSITVVTPQPPLTQKWVERITDQQKVVLGKDKAREEAIKKVHGKNSCCLIL